MRSVLAALGQGMSMVRRAAACLLLAYVLNVALAGILAAVVFGALETSLGTSLAGARMREGWDARWYEAFAVQAQGVASTFRPSLSGPGGVLDAVEAFLDGFSSLLARGPGSGVLVAMGAYLLLWMFLGAAFLGRFAEQPTRRGFLAGGTRWLPRLLPLSLIGLVFYALVLGPVRTALEGAARDRAIDVIDERVQFTWMLAAHLIVWALVVLGNLVLDYAKVLVVLRDERASLRRPFRAIKEAAELVARRPVATVGLYLATASLGGLVLAAYVAVAPEPGHGSEASIAAALVLTQAFAASRIALRALFLAGEVVTARSVAALLPADASETGPVVAAGRLAASVRVVTSLPPSEGCHLISD